MRILYILLIAGSYLVSSWLHEPAKLLAQEITAPPAEAPAAEPALDTDTETEARRNVFTIAGGIFLNDGRDLVVSSLYRLGLGGNLHLGYEHIAPQHYHYVQMTAGAGALLVNYATGDNGPVTQSGADLDILVNLAYSSAFSVLRTKVATLYLGFMVEGNLDFWLIQNFLSYGWSATMTIGPALMVNFALKKHHLRIHYYLPVIGAVARPRFNVYNFHLEQVLENSNGLVDVLINTLLETTALYHWGNTVRTTAAVTYEWFFTPTMALHTQYAVALEYFVEPVPKNKLTFTQKLNVGIAIYW